MRVRDRIEHGFNAFKNPELYPRRTNQFESAALGVYARPDRPKLQTGNERSLLASVLTRIAVDVAAMRYLHVRTDEDGQFRETITSSLNTRLNLNANADQTGRDFIKDVVSTMCDEGCAAIVITAADIDPEDSATFKIDSMRVGHIIEWYPKHIKVMVYNEDTGLKEQIIVPKSITPIVENPFYAVMNEPNSTLRRLIRKLNLLDAIDEQSGSGKLDLILQVPYLVKNPVKKEYAQSRLKEIETQLAGSKYGIAYTDGTEHIVQLNRPVENNLMTQIDYLTKLFYSQLGISEGVLNGTASEEEKLMYYNGTIEPYADVIVDALRWKLLTKTARTQGQDIQYFRDPFKIVPIEKIADVADKFTRNEILTPNELRSIVGRKPSKDKAADELRNRNINQKAEDASDPAKIQNGSNSSNFDDKDVADLIKSIK